MCVTVAELIALTAALAGQKGTNSRLATLNAITLYIAIMQISARHAGTVCVRNNAEVTIVDLWC
jgi:hypothetical protein